MFANKVLSGFARMAVASMILAACATPTSSVGKDQPAASGAVTPAIIPSEIAVVPTPTTALEARSKDPATLINVWGAGSNPETLDPALNYESAGAHILQHVYESLITYQKSSPVDYVPQLATEWKVADDGKTYVFKIRQGVKFHGGETLTPQDVAYTFHRGLLQGGTQSPQWLLAQLLLGAHGAAAGRHAGARCAYDW